MKKLNIKAKNKIEEQRYRIDKIYYSEWILAAAVGFLVFISSQYIDLRSLTVWSTNVWDCLFSGNIRNLYMYSYQNVHNAAHQYLGSELMSILPLSIWNIPIWISQTFFHHEISESAIMLGWSKSFFVALSVVMVIISKKLAYIVTQDHDKSMIAAFLSGSSVFLYISVCFAGQNDIVMIVPSLIAIYYLFNNDEKKFLIWSALTISIKPFFLLPFVAILILYEKNILFIIAKAAIGVSGVFVQKLLFMGAPLYAESMENGPSKRMFNNMFPGNIPTAFGYISLFAVALVLIYLLSYTRPFSKKTIAEEPQKFAKYAVYLVTLTYMSYVMFSPFSYYRIAVIVPFLYIVIVQNSKMNFYNLIFDVVFSFSLVTKIMLRSSNIFKVDFVNGSILARTFGYDVKAAQSGFLEGVDSYLYATNELINHLQSMFTGLTVICLGLLLFFNRPDKDSEFKVSGEKNCRGLLWAHALIIAPFILLTIWLFANAPVKEFYIR